MKIGQHVIWVPREVSDPDWSHNDEWNNEFTYTIERALTNQEMDEYMEWSRKVQHGTVTRFLPYDVVQGNSEVFEIRLLEPFGIFEQLPYVTYPIESNLGEYWLRVQESPDYVNVRQICENEITWGPRCTSPDASAGFIYTCKELDCPKHGERNKEWRKEEN